MFELKVRKLVHQVKVVIFKPHVLSNVHKLNLSFNESSLGSLGQLTLGLLRCTFDLVQEREVEPFVEEVTDGKLFLHSL